jgi:hypothetical protein
MKETTYFRRLGYIQCGTYGGGPHRCPRRMQSVMDGEGAAGMGGAYGA